MKLRWLLWIVVALLLLAYCAAGYIASRPEIVSITLEPGFSSEVRVLRMVRQDLQMQLMFWGDHNKRPELGDWANAGDGNVLKFSKPGAAIHLTASASGSAPVTFEAMPKSSYTTATVSRHLTSSLSTGPGVWEQRRSPGVALLPGVTTVTITVTSVEAPLVGETVELRIEPPLTFKWHQQGVGWLWYWFFWPFMVAILAAWALALVVLDRRRRR